MQVSKSILAIIAAGSVLASACTTLDPYTREEQTARAQRNAVIGAVSGAVAGLVTGDSSMERKKRALVGAGLGALAGAAVGGYMDRQEMKLRAELERTGVGLEAPRVAGIPIVRPRPPSGAWFGLRYLLGPTSSTRLPSGSRTTVR